MANSGELRIVFEETIRLAHDCCKRWGVEVDVPEEADIHTAAIIVRTAIKEAARRAREFPSESFYADDYPGLVNSWPGVSQKSLIADISDTGPSGPGWGICARVEVTTADGEFFFDVVIVYNIEKEAVDPLLKLLQGREQEFIDTDAIAQIFNAEALQVSFHADNWGKLKDISLKGALPLAETLLFRRPGAWDLMRGEELGEVAADELPPFSRDDFERRKTRSMRYDPTIMEMNRNLLWLLSQEEPEPFTDAWQAWFPTVRDYLNSIGAPAPIPGMSVVLNFVSEEPTESGDSWAAIATHTVVVACGLDPIAAGQVLQIVRHSPAGFYDLPASGTKNFRLMAVSAIPDVRLSQVRATLSGRTDLYERMVEAGKAAA